jgi:hypothetical protein
MGFSHSLACGVPGLHRRYYPRHSARRHLRHASQQAHGALLQPCRPARRGDYPHASWKPAGFSAL